MFFGQYVSDVMYSQIHIYILIYIYYIYIYMLYVGILRDSHWFSVAPKNCCCLHVFWRQSLHLALAALAGGTTLVPLPAGWAADSWRRGKNMKHLCRTHLKRSLFNDFNGFIKFHKLLSGSICQLMYGMAKNLARCWWVYQKNYGIFAWPDMKFPRLIFVEPCHTRSM